MKEETKKKISESMKGNKNHFYGKKHSTESKIKMSIARRKRKTKKIECVKCGRKIISKTYNKKYCAECKKIANREKNRRAEVKRKDDPKRKKWKKEWRTEKRKDPLFRKREAIEKSIYLKTPKGKARAKRNNQKRYAREKGVIHAFTDAEWQEKVKATKGRCPKCNSKFTKEKWSLHYMERDHDPAIMNVPKDYKYTIDEVFPLCKSCNSKKNQWVLKKEKKYLEMIESIKERIKKNK